MSVHAVTAIHRGICGSCRQPIEYRVFRNGATWVHTGTGNPLASEHSPTSDIRDTDGVSWWKRDRWRARNAGIFQPIHIYSNRATEAA